MKSLYTLISVFILLSVFSCNPPPELDEEPTIEFKEVQFKNIANGSDSLIVTIEFGDGDGDLGLAGDETYFPYHEYNFFKDDDGNYITIGDDPSLPEFNYCDYLIDPVINNQQVNDTVYVEINERHYNIFIDFLVDYQGNGTFEEFDFRRDVPSTGCDTYDGRFFRLKNDDKKRPLTGELRYSIIGNVFPLIFRNYNMKLEVMIMDRAGNKSNVASSEIFTLEGISQ